MNLQQAFYYLKENLTGLYDAQEATFIAHALLEHITGLSKIDRLMKKTDLLSPEQLADYHEASKKLIAGKPLQQVIGYAWFLERKFKVNEHVLIPRPETEELVYWVTNDWKEIPRFISILDIGTGSGCIPISLKLGLENATVTSFDISDDALNVARINGFDLDADVRFYKDDILNPLNTKDKFDVIVSNPPYIPESERENMHTNVKDHEPALALFTPSDDPLLFYKAIADFAKQHLKERGAVYCELHLDHAILTKEMFEEKGYKTDLRKDMHGNWRMLKAWTG